MMVMHNVVLTQAANCHICLQIGTTAYFFGERRGRGYGMKIEIMTPEHTFRFSPWRR